VTKDRRCAGGERLDGFGAAARPRFVPPRARDRVEVLLAVRVGQTLDMHGRRIIRPKSVPQLSRNLKYRRKGVLFGRHGFSISTLWAVVKQP